MPKLPIPVPPPEEIDGAADGEVLFVIPAQRRQGAPAPGALRGIASSWLVSGEASLLPGQAAA